MKALEKFINSPLHKSDQPKKKYKLKYLSDDTQKFFKEGIELFYKCYGLSDERHLSMKELNEHLKIAQRIAEETNDFSEVRRILQLLTDKYRYEKSLKWYLDYSEILQSDEIWESYKTAENINPDKIRKLEAMQKKWKRHASFAHYTSDALLYATDILTELEDHLKLAQVEFIRYGYKFEEKDRIEYHKHLELFLQAVQDQKKTLCEAMFIRWKLALQNNNLRADILVNMIQQLNQMGIIEEKEWSERQRQPQTREHNEALFIKFYHYIANNAKPELKEAASLSISLLGEKPNEIIHLIPIKQDNDSFLIPKQFEANTPAYRKKPDFIFKGHNLRHDFFQDKQDLFFRLIQLRGLKVAITHYERLPEDPLWIELQSLCRLIESHITISEQKIIRGFFARYKMKSNQFLKEWQDFLTNQQKVVLLYQLEFLENFASNIKFLKHQFEEPALEENTVRQIQSIFNNLHDTLSHVVVTQNQMSRMLVLGQNLFNLFQTEKKFKNQISQAEEIIHSLEQLVSKLPVHKEQFKKITQSYSESFLFKQESFKAQKTKNIMSIGQLLCAFLDGQPSLSNDLSSEYFKNWVDQCTQLVYQYGSGELLKELETSVINFRDRYRKYLRSIKNFNLIKDNNDLFSSLESLVERIAPVDYTTQIKDFKIAREVLKENSSEFPGTYKTLNAIFRSSDPSYTDSDAENSDVIRSNLLDSVGLKKQLEESKDLREEIDIMLKNFQDNQPNQNELPYNRSEEISSNQHAHLKGLQDSAELTPELLLFCDRAADQVLEKLSTNRPTNIENSSSTPSENAFQP
jgi:hypothetical protein